MSEELKPCPFCGGEAKMNQVGNGVYEIVCSNNGCRVQPETPRVGDEAEAVKAWNTRAERTCHYVFTTNYALPDDPQEDFRADYYACDQCGYWVPDFRWEDEGEFAYCPNCGAKVVE